VVVRPVGCPCPQAVMRRSCRIVAPANLGRVGKRSHPLRKLRHPPRVAEVRRFPPQIVQAVNNLGTILALDLLKGAGETPSNVQQRKRV
jgi:hypothetical protein